MKKLNLLLMMLLALLVTACSDSENEEPNGGGGGTNKGNIVGLNIKDAKLIYGVEKASTRSALKSMDNSISFRQVTRENKDLAVNWVKESGDTTSVIRIEAIANLSDDHLIIGTHQVLDDDHGAMVINLLSYIINKNTGIILNPTTPIENINLIDDNFFSFYDRERRCYVKAEGQVLEIDLQSYSVTPILEKVVDIKVTPDASFFAYMADGNHKYGNFKLHIIEEFSEIERFKGWDNYIPVDGLIDGLLTIVCNKKNTDGTTTYTTISFSSSVMWDYGFSDQFDVPNTYLTTNFELPPNFLLYRDALAYSVNTSRTTQFIYLGASNRELGIVLNFDAWNGLTRLSDDLIVGLISGKTFGNYNRNIYPDMATNSVASFNSKENGELVITEFSTMTQKTIKDAKGYRISAIVQEKIADTKPITFIGDNWQEKKQCVGTIDAKGNAEILQEFNSNDSGAMTGFLLNLR